MVAANEDTALDKARVPRQGLKFQSGMPIGFLTKETGMNQTQITDLFEEQLRSMARATSVRQVMVSLHNMCCHGEIFEETGEDVSEDQLGELFDHFDGILSILKS